MNKHGLITPSGFRDMMMRGTKGEEFGKTAMTYAERVALERLGVEFPDIKAASLSHGNEWEKYAINEYEKRFEYLVLDELPPIAHPRFSYVGGTPDGLVNEDGIIEVKCPFNPANHLANIRFGEQIDQYKWQMQGYLWITGRKWCDFVSYDPRFPEDLRMYVQRLERSEIMIEELEDRIVKFEAIINRILKGIVR